ncbi:MAG: RluA family pseudouridine synthase [Clostridia bacterium]|nr:RluA family pseudouridine synthase [Clostridia bacterium]
MKRRIEYVAPFDGRIEDILKFNGVSSSVCVSLRKSLGLVCKIVDGREIPLRLVDILSQGEVFCIYLVDEDVKSIPKSDIPVNIVYEDEDIAVIDKQAGLAVIPVRGHYGRCLANALANMWGDFVYRPVNRLDRDTSGLMIVAKNQLAHGVLSAEHIYREYVALCSGVFAGEKSGEINLPIKRCGESMRREVNADGESAITHYEILNQYADYFSAKFVLKTGRTHQIRVHASHMGYPLCCDKLYNPNPQNVICPSGKTLDRQALHSCKLQFAHPISKEIMTFESHAEFLQYSLSFDI